MEDYPIITIDGKDYYDVTPSMTSDITPSPYEVIPSSAWDGQLYGGYKAFNGTNVDANDCWASNNGEPNAYIIFNFGENRKVSHFTLTSRNYSDTTSSPKSFTILGSNDNIHYTKIKDYTDNSFKTNETKLFSFDKTVNFKYYKLQVNETNGQPYTTIGELNYLLGKKDAFYLIKDNGNNKIYNYDKDNNKLVEVTDISILKENALNNTCIYDLNNVLPLLSNLSDDLTLLSNKDAAVLVNGIKSTKELIVGKNSFSTRIASNIDWFKLDDDAIAKVVFTIDDGTTWKTYNTSNSAFEDLSVSIPNNKDYKDFTDEEKMAWNEAKEIFYNQGIDSSILNTIDFNSFDIEDIRFGYVLTAIDSNTMDKMKNLIWQFDSKGTMDLVDTSQVRQQLYYAGTKLISNIDADMLKVNITYEGINNNS